jgi:hypothetical protein
MPSIHPIEGLAIAGRMLILPPLNNFLDFIPTELRLSGTINKSTGLYRLVPTVA